MSDEKEGDLLIDQLKILTSKESDQKHPILSTELARKESMSNHKFPSSLSTVSIIAERDGQVPEKGWSLTYSNSIPSTWI